MCILRLSCSESTLTPPKKLWIFIRVAMSACEVELWAARLSEHSRVETMIRGDSLHGWRPKGSDMTHKTAISSVWSVSEWKSALTWFKIDFPGLNQSSSKSWKWEWGSYLGSRFEVNLFVILQKMIAQRNVSCSPFMVHTFFLHFSMKPTSIVHYGGIHSEL